MPGELIHQLLHLKLRRLTAKLHWNIILTRFFFFFCIHIYYIYIFLQFCFFKYVPVWTFLLKWLDAVQWIRYIYNSCRLLNLWLEMKIQMMVYGRKSEKRSIKMQRGSSKWLERHMQYFQTLPRYRFIQNLTVLSQSLLWFLTLVTSFFPYS